MIKVTFTCPSARDAQEPGGGYSLYVAPVFGEDAMAAATCAAP